MLLPGCDEMTRLILDLQDNNVLSRVANLISRDHSYDPLEDQGSK